MLINPEIPMDLQKKKILELIRECIRVAECNMNIQKPITFMYTYNKKTQNLKTKPLTIA